ncbi:MAG: 16S rRNA (cytidine(1402)-2'-O)-methyltransferase [Steroidobacteraceae bacterium]
MIVVGSAGRLDVVATPIGNLADLSPRAREALAGADLIAAEDTRHTSILLASCGISRPMVSLHQHNEAGRIAPLLDALRAGSRIALVSDAGTPLLSDPGFALVRAAAQAGFEVRAIPGPSAIAAALSIAGIATDRFAFEGFLPARGSARRQALRALAAETRTLVFFEAPHRIGESLADLAAELGAGRQAAVTRELTKSHESVYRATLGELAELAKSDENLSRGEITLVVEGAAAADTGADLALLERALALLVPELPPARAAAIAAQLSGAARNVAYARALALSGK